MDASVATSFKGWTIPGVRVPGGVAPEDHESLDALSGHFKLFQLKKGHRFSTDDLLVAWYGTMACPTARRVLDLGSGIGTVGMISAWRLTGAQFVTVEAQDESVALARKSVIYNGLSARYEIRQGDFRDASVFFEGEDASFDLVTGSPPYFPLDAGIHGDHPQKIACRFEVRGDVGDYCRAAAPRLAPGGVFACVFPIQPFEQEKRVWEGAKSAGLVVIRSRPVVLREGEPPLLGLFVMMRATDLPEGFRSGLGEQGYREPKLMIRRKDGSIHPEYSVVKLSIGFPPKDENSGLAPRKKLS